MVQEAVGTGNPELLQLVLARRDYQRYCNRVAGIPELLYKLKQVSIVPINNCKLILRIVLNECNFFSGSRLLCRDEMGIHKLG